MGTGGSKWRTGDEDESYPSVNLGDESVVQGNRERGFPDNYTSTTKYSPAIIFLPKVIWLQFKRVMNMYFLLVAVATSIPQVSPVTWTTSVLPLVIRITVAIFREGIEDLLRYRADTEVNERLYKRIRRENNEGASPMRSGSVQADLSSSISSEANDLYTEVQSQNIQVGDLILITRDDVVPADVVVLGVSDVENGYCFVETAQLDGETNLKRRYCVSETLGVDTKNLATMSAMGEFGVPNTDLYHFNGRLHMDGEDRPIALNRENLLLRGTNLRNVEWIVGLVAYAGVDTKLSLNQRDPPTKFSRLDKWLDYGVTFFLFGFSFALELLGAIMSVVFWQENREAAWYLGRPTVEELPTWLIGIQDFVSFFVIISYVIPISMVITLEFARVAQKIYMEWDPVMATDPEDSSTGMNCKTTNLNDELALVKHLFSDKTGTLTRNAMVFKHSSIRGLVCKDCLDGSITEELDKLGSEELAKREDIIDFLRALALCNSIEPEVTGDSDNSDRLYKASSPDEEALVEAGVANGFSLWWRKKNIVRVREFGEFRDYEILNVAEFTSARRRMTVVVRTPEGDVVAYSKGADMAIYERLAPRDEHVKRLVNENLNEFSREGLRTLVLAQRKFSPEDYEEFSQAYHAASILIDGREAEVERINSEVLEIELSILGCTAIEDRLSDEVPETIEYLLAAGIAVWVITGDKLDTAVNIGYSCRLLDRSMEVLTLKCESSDECGTVLASLARAHFPRWLDEQDNAQRDLGRRHRRRRKKKQKKMHRENKREATRHRSGGLGLVIDGKTLRFALEDHKEVFLQLSSVCRSVLCCRVTPMQKALVVQSIQEATGDVCCSIGDGANDVAMIQEADIGLGIWGKEGTQAARASDYAIHEFKHLRQLLCVHGRYNFRRNIGLIMLSLYKNNAFFLAQFWFAIYSAFSSQTLYDQWALTFFNLLFTSIPPFTYAIFEKDIDEKMIYKYPELYLNSQKAIGLGIWAFTSWLIEGLYHSVVFFFLTLLFLGDSSIRPDGLSTGMATAGYISSQLGVFVVLMRILLESNWVNVANQVAVWLSLMATTAYGAAMSGDGIYLPMTGVFNVVMGAPLSYLFWALGAVVALVPPLTMRFLKRRFWPKDWQILQERRIRVKKKLGVDIATTERAPLLSTYAAQNLHSPPSAPADPQQEASLSSSAQSMSSLP